MTRSVIFALILMIFGAFPAMAADDCTAENQFTDTDSGKCYTCDETTTTRVANDDGTYYCACNVGYADMSYDRSGKVFCKDTCAINQYAEITTNSSYLTPSITGGYQYTCTTCPLPSILNQDRTGCDTCSALSQPFTETISSPLTYNRECRLCGGNQYWGYDKRLSSFRCVQCSPDFIAQEGHCPETDGTDTGSDDYSCINNQAYWERNEPSSCVWCGANSYADENNQCVKCPATTYYDGHDPILDEDGYCELDKNNNCKLTPICAPLPDGATQRGDTHGFICTKEGYGPKWDHQTHTNICAPCAFNEKPENGTCTSCGNGYYDTSKGTCVSCGTGETARNEYGNISCVCDTSDGYGTNGGTECVLCTDNDNGTNYWAVDWDTRQCKQCPANMVPSRGSAYYDQCTCPNGWFYKNYFDDTDPAKNSCVEKCETSSKDDTNTYHQETIEGALVDTNIICHICKAGETYDTDKHKCICPTGSAYKDDTRAECISCTDANQYIDDKNICHTCGEGMIYDTSKKSCVCDAGYAYTDSTKKSCTTCTAETNNYIDGNGICQNCNGENFAVIDNQCTCVEGYVFDASGQHCIQCGQPGTYSDKGECKACPAGQFSGENATRCLSCPPVYIYIGSSDTPDAERCLETAGESGECLSSLEREITGNSCTYKYSHSLPSISFSDVPSWAQSEACPNNYYPDIVSATSFIKITCTPALTLNNETLQINDSRSGAVYETERSCMNKTTPSILVPSHQVTVDNTPYWVGDSCLPTGTSCASYTEALKVSKIKNALGQITTTCYNSTSTNLLSCCEIAVANTSYNANRVLTAYVQGTVSLKWDGSKIELDEPSNGAYDACAPGEFWYADNVSCVETPTGFYNKDFSNKVYFCPNGMTTASKASTSITKCFYGTGAQGDGCMRSKLKLTSDDGGSHYDPDRPTPGDISNVCYKNDGAYATTFIEYSTETNAKANTAFVLPAGVTVYYKELSNFKSK